jgi:TRAP-type C4-dicarboxylate transport system permease small subunit
MLNIFDKIVRLWSRWFNWLALTALIAMVGVVSVDIIGAKIFCSPLAGAVELVSFLGVVVAGFSAARTYEVGRHIRVDFIMRLLPVRAQRILSCIALLLSMVLFILLIWRTFLYGRDIQEAGEVSLTLNIPHSFLLYGLAVACIPLFLLLLGEFVRSLIEVKKR